MKIIPKNKKYTFTLISTIVLVAFAVSACSFTARPEPPPVPSNEMPLPSSPKTQAPASVPETSGGAVETQTSKPQETVVYQQPSDEIAVQSVAPDAALASVSGKYLFTEGPAADAQGNIFFSDINAGRIYKWSPDGQVTVFREGLKGPNGLEFTSDGILIVCEGGNGRLISIDPQGQLTLLADQYNHKRFNEPNDLWIDPQGGIYFTDPAYQSPVVQDGEHVYYLSPDRSLVTRVVADFVRPNGIVGTSDGKTLYVTDHGAGKTYSYKINPDGTLSGKKLLVSLGSDGMALDASGNLFLTTPNQVQVVDPLGNRLWNIPTKENPTNLTFGGEDGLTLFITARTAVYTLQLKNQDSNQNPPTPVVQSQPSTTANFTLTSTDVTESGRLPTEYTCDGDSSTLPIAWSGAPAGTKEYALVMHHVAGPDDIHWYWVLYNIPANVSNLDKNSTGIGTLGANSVNRKQAYTPPCSKGPGDKTYTYTIYALSAQPQFSVPASQINRAVLLDAIKNITLASAEMHVVYARK